MARLGIRLRGIGVFVGCALWLMASCPLGAEAGALAQARMLEGRDEPLAAQMQYLQAAAEAREQALLNGEDAAALWARVEFCYEKAVLLAVQSGEAEEVLRALEQPDDKAPPALNARKTWLSARFAFRRGEADAARKLADNLGMIRNWLVLGPFENEKGRSFDTAFIPESGTAFSLEPRRGKRREVVWRPLQSGHPLGAVDLGAWLRPSTECLAYAACLVNSDGDRNALLQIGSDDGVSVWVNGAQLLREPLRREAEPDQNTVPVSLRSGWNLLLVKCAQEEGAWRFFARLTDGAGAPLGGVTYHAATGDFSANLSAVRMTQADDAAVLSAEKPDLPGAVPALTKMLEKFPADAEMLHELGWLMYRRQSAGADSLLPRQLLQQAVQADAETAKWRWLDYADVAASRGEGPDRDENLHLDCLQKAAADDMTQVAALARMAQYDLTVMQIPTRAETSVDKALQKNPLSPLSLTMRFDLFRGRGWTALAEEQAAEMRRQMPSAVDVRLREARLMLDLSRPVAALEALAVVLRQDAANAGALEMALRAWGQTGRLPEADAALARALTLEPGNVTWIQERASVLRRLGQADKALTLLDGALRACPESHELLAARGDALQTLGRSKDALTSWKQALTLEPGAVKLREYLDAFGEENAAQQRITVVDDLSAFATQAREFAADNASDHAVLLEEEVERLHGDGTFRRRVHAVVRIDKAPALERFAAIPIFWEEGHDRVVLHGARVLSGDGATVEGRLTEIREGISVLHFPLSEPGDVLEYDYEIERHSPNFFGDYFAKSLSFRKFAPARLLRYVLVAPKDRPLYMHLKNGMTPALEEEGEGAVVRTWQMRNVPAIEKEPYMPPLPELAPTLQISTFKNWDELAIWYWHLIKDQHQITDELREITAKVTADAANDNEKIDAIYGWVSENIRNVTWPFGVHGFKPYKADTIMNRRFGDCKDKSTLINVMAREVGLSAWPVLLRAVEGDADTGGRGREDLELPMLLHFNHAISHAFLGGRDVWLDATIPYRISSGVPFTDAGAEAVIVGPEGATRVKLPGTAPEDNALEEDFRLTLDDRGGCEAEQILTGSGRVAETMRALFRRPERRDRVLHFVASNAYGGLRAAHVDEYDDGTLAERDAVKLTGRMILKDYGRFQDKTLRVAFPKALLRAPLDKGGALPESLSPFAPYSYRKHDLLLPMALRIRRTVSLSWPDGWTPRALPAPRDLDYPFARCRISADVVGRTLKIDCLVEWKTNRIAAADYAAFRDLCAAADELDRYTLILEKP